MQKTPNPFSLSPAQAGFAALIVAQKLAACDDAKLARFIATSPAFGELTEEARSLTAPLTLDIIDAPDGMDTLLALISAAMPQPQADGAYLACAEFIALYGRISPEEMRFLERFGESLNIDRLARAAYDRAAQARALILSGAENG